jgi:hypothetical protein
MFDQRQIMKSPRSLLFSGFSMHLLSHFKCRLADNFYTSAHIFWYNSFDLASLGRVNGSNGKCRGKTKWSMQPKKKKLIIKISAAVFLLFAVFFAYAIGLLHLAALAVATKMDIEWRVSAPQSISVYYPRWACGPFHPFSLLVEADAAEAAPLTVGEPVWIFDEYGRDNINFGEHDFAECRGRFKSSLTRLIKDHQNTVGIWRNADSSVTGRFFEFEYCTPKEPSAEQWRKIGEWLEWPD